MQRLEAVLDRVDKFHFVVKVGIAFGLFHVFIPLSMLFVCWWVLPKKKWVNLGALVIGGILLGFYLKPSPDPQVGQETEEVTESQDPVGPPSLIDETAYNALIQKGQYNAEELTQVLNKAIQDYLDGEGEYGGLIGGVYVGRLKQEITYIDSYEMFKDKQFGVNTQRKFVDGAYKVTVPYPSYDILAIWSVPQSVHTDQLLLNISKIIGQAIQQSQLSVRRFKFVQYRDPQVIASTKWSDGNILYGVVTGQYCKDVYKAYTEDSDTGNSVFKQYASEENDAWGSKIWDRPVSIQEMIESGDVTAPFHQLGIKDSYERTIKNNVGP